VYVHTPTPAGDIELWSVNRATGERRWRTTVAAKANHQIEKHDLTTPSPVTNGQSIWSLTGGGVLARVDSTGRVVWHHDLQARYGRFGQQFGFAASPLLVDGRLVIPVLHGTHTDASSYLLCLDADSGRVVWRVDRPTPAVRESRDAYSTPTVVSLGQTRVVVVSGGDVLTGHDLATGREVWRAGGLNPGKRAYHQVIASPFVTGTTLIVPTRIKPLLAFSLSGAVEAPALRWSFDRGGDVPTPVSDARHVWVVSDVGVVHVLHIVRGDVVHGPIRLRPGTYAASPVLAGGRVFVTNEHGETSVLAAHPPFAVLAENSLEDVTLSSPAIAGGRLFIRTAGFLWAIEGIDP
jgi:outer membrane protein assembly factor BamB